MREEFINMKLKFVRSTFQSKEQSIEKQILCKNETLIRLFLHCTNHDLRSIYYLQINSCCTYIIPLSRYKLRCHYGLTSHRSIVNNLQDLGHNLKAYSYPRLGECTILPQRQFRTNTTDINAHGNNLQKRRITRQNNKSNQELLVALLIYCCKQKNKLINGVI